MLPTRSANCLTVSTALHSEGTGKETRQYDIVLGPVANDQTIRTVNDFINGYLTEDIAIQILLPQKLKDQYAFKTEKALNNLHFKEAIV